MATKQSKLERDEIIIAALISNSTVRGAAAACGLSETTVFGRLRDPAFKDRYREARHDVLQQASAYLQGIVGEAIQKMYEVMTDPENAPQVQLNAAMAIVKAQQTMTEQTDVLAELAELRKVVLDGNQQH